MSTSRQYLFSQTDTTPHQTRHDDNSYLCICTQQTGLLQCNTFPITSSVSLIPTAVISGRFPCN